MDYLEYFDLASEPFSNAPLSRFYYASRQHTEALERLRYAASTMKGLAILIGEIGLGKTTLARRMLESLPEDEYEAAMLVIVHAGINPNWLLKRIAIQLGVPSPADDKLTILSQLYQRLVQIYESGKRAVVIIDEAQMLATRELMEEFRGLLNLEVPERKLISFIFFGLPEIERNLRLDPPLAQRIALRYHMKPLGREDTLAYIEHRLSLAGGGGREFFSQAALDEVYRFTKGVPRLVNTLCDNLLLELFFTKEQVANADTVVAVAENLGFGRDFDVSSMDAEPEPAHVVDPLAVEGGPGADAIVAVDPAVEETAQALIESDDGSWDTKTPPATPIEPDAIAAQVAAEPMPGDDSTADLAVPDEIEEAGPPPPPDDAEPASLPEHEDRGPPVGRLERRDAQTTVDIEDPLAFLEPTTPEPPQSPSPWEDTTQEIEIQVVDHDDADVPEIEATEVVDEEFPVHEAGADFAIVEEGQKPEGADDGVDFAVVEDELDDAGAFGTVEDEPGDDDDEFEVHVEEPEEALSVPPPLPPPLPVAVPEPPAPAEVPEAKAVEPPTEAPPAPAKSRVDLSDIDALLADIDLTLKK